MNILIVTNNQTQKTELCELISKTYGYVRCFPAASYSQAVQEIKKRRFQMFLLDVGLGAGNSDENGITLGALIRSMAGYADIPIVYFNGDRPHAVAAIHHANCYDYLMSSCDKSEVLHTVDRYLLSYARRRKPLEFRLPEGGKQRVDAVDIEYIESCYGCLYIHTRTETIIVPGLFMQQVLRGLPKEFVRTHRSYIVNMHYFKSYNPADGALFIENNRMPIPVSRRRKNIVKRALNVAWQLEDDEAV